jgi:DNA-binding NarL/FixJ family response regulator
MRDGDVEVLIVDDHPVVGDGLVQLLRFEGIAAMPLVPTSPGHVMEVTRTTGARLVLLDLDLGWPQETGLDLIRPLRGEGVAAVVYSGTRDRRLLALALEAGATGAVTKGQGIDALIDAVIRARNGEAVNNLRERCELADELQQYRARQRERLAPFRALTAREAFVLQDLMEGRSAEVIASGSFVALSTVRSQIRAILSKLNVSSQLAAVALAQQARWSADGHADAGEPTVAQQAG